MYCRLVTMVQPTVRGCGPNLLGPDSWVVLGLITME